MSGKMAKRNTRNSYPLIDNNCTGKISVPVLELWHLLKACNILNVNCDWVWSILVLHIVAFYTHQPWGKCTSARSRLHKDCRSQDRQEEPNSLNKRSVLWSLMVASDYKAAGRHGQHCCNLYCHCYKPCLLQLKQLPRDFKNWHLFLDPVFHPSYLLFSPFGSQTFKD